MLQLKSSLVKILALLMVGAFILSSTGCIVLPDDDGYYGHRGYHHHRHHSYHRDDDGYRIRK